MEARSVLVCLFVCVCFGGVFGQVASLCRPNERLLACGCPKTCRDPVPDCKGVCKMGCFCEDGQVRNEEGICVDLANCPRLSSPYKLESLEPRLHGGDCPEGEEYRPCEPCSSRSCANPNPMCPAQCSRGCFCKGDLLRDKDGRCVKYEKCSNVIDYIKEREKGVIFEPIPYRYSCGKNQQYQECQKCSQSCSDPEPVCGKCKTGCVCKDGFVKGPDGKCIKKEECPKAATTFFDSHISSIEECSSVEEYLSCGWCEATCQDPTPNCPHACVRGCLCKPPLVRHATGQCVSPHHCGSRKCSKPNEEYTCRHGCERRCSSGSCPEMTMMGSRCVLGCYCKRGHLRDASNKCVTEEQCFTNSTVIVI